MALPPLDRAASISRTVRLISSPSASSCDPEIALDLFPQLPDIVGLQPAEHHAFSMTVVKAGAKQLAVLRQERPELGLVLVVAAGRPLFQLDPQLSAGCEVGL